MKNQSKPNSVTLTDVYLRGYTGVAHKPQDMPQREPIPTEPAYTVLPNGELSPFRLLPVTLDYPHITEQPTYKIEAEKLARFQERHAQATADLARLYDERKAQTAAVDAVEDDAIDKAESMMAGEVPKDFVAEIEATSRLIETLSRAITAQEKVVRGVNRDLSHAAGRRYAQEHKDLVKRLAAAVIELHAANEAEKALRYDLVRLGYGYSTLPAMDLHTVEDPTDRTGGITYHWHREARSYTKSPAELAAGLRKARLAELTS